jgi:drug/metabolite transporter (DMT)-like permease
MLFWVSVYACPVLLAMGIMLGEPILPTNWTPVVALAIASQLVGQGLVVFSLRHFSPLVIGLALLTQPAVAALTGYLAFGELLSPLDVFGMALLGAALVAARARRG